MAIDRSKPLMQTLRRLAFRGIAPELTDGQLLGRFIEHRDEASFEALVRRHGAMVLGVCRRLLHNSQDAEDAFQAVFVVLVRKAVSVSPREMVGNWLYGVAYQTALKGRAVAARRRARERQVKEMPEPEAVDRDLWGDLLPLLDRELSRLPDKYRVPIVLCELEGKTHKEAARQLGCPEGTVSARLSRARGMLAKRLARCGLAVTAGALAAALSQNAASASVPAPLLASTVKTATLIAAGGTAAGLVAGPVAVLSKGVLKAMLVSKLQTCAAVLLTLVLIGVGVGGFSGPTAAADSAKPTDSPPSLPATRPANAAQATLPFDQFQSAEPVDGQVFILVNTGSGRCLSVLNGGRDKGRHIVQGPPAADAGPAERWKAVKVGDYFKLINVNSGKVLADPEGSKEKNARMIQWDDLGLEDQQWEFVPVGRHYSLKNRASGLLVAAPPPNDATARSGAAGPPAVAQDAGAGAKQPDPSATAKEPGLMPTADSAPGALGDAVSIAASDGSYNILAPKPGLLIGNRASSPAGLGGGGGAVAPAPKPGYLIENPGAAVPPAVVQSGATGRPDQVWFIQWVPEAPGH